MTTLTLNLSINKIQNLASSLASHFTPYFFVKQNHKPNLPIFGNPSIRINNQMTPFLDNLPSHAKLGFWSISQLSQANVPKKILENSIIINPYKTESLIIEALKKGVTRMLVSDIEEVIKIQRKYFHLKREEPKIKEPQFIWSVEDIESDLQNLTNLEKCSLPFSGVYFGAHTSMKEVSSFLENDKIKGKRLLNYKETSIKHFDLNGKVMKQLNVDPMITNYSEIEDYVMVCRVLGKDRSGKAVFDESCSEFTCKNEACTCLNSQTKVIEYFSAEGFEWAIVKPTRLDKLAKEHIYE